MQKYIVKQTKLGEVPVAMSRNKALPGTFSPKNGAARDPVILEGS